MVAAFYVCPLPILDGNDTTTLSLLEAFLTLKRDMFTGDQF
jgi:hypothetical protein